MNKLKELTEENTEFFNKITQLNNDILNRKNVLAHWPEISAELRDAVEVAYHDSLLKSEIIKDALNEIINLKSIIDYINETVKSNECLNDQQLHLNNIDNLVSNYLLMKTSFLDKHGKLLSAEFTL
jgi:uncharacterized protein YigA (DUF484 family)